MDGNRPVRWTLPTPVVEAVSAMARAEGLSADAVAARALLRGLQEIGAAPSGRCSVRTGQCSEGPQPLPLQQGGGR